MSKVKGFDYRICRTVERKRSEWSSELRQVVDTGGRRRVENEETFAHGKDGRILFEVYDNVPTARAQS